MSDLQWHPKTCFNFDSFPIVAEAINVEKPKIKNISFKKQKHEYIKCILDQTNLLRVTL